MLQGIIFDTIEFVNDDVAVVQLAVDIPDIYTGTVDGTARRDPIDKPDDQLALKLAWGRALEKLSHRILRQANGLVKHNDDLREQKTERQVAESFYRQAVNSVSTWFNFSSPNTVVQQKLL